MSQWWRVSQSTLERLTVGNVSHGGCEEETFPSRGSRWKEATDGRERDCERQDARKEWDGEEDQINDL